MAGVVSASVRPEARATFIANLRWACESARGQGVTVLIEALNPRDIPNYLFSTQAEAHSIREAVGAPNLKAQMDFYHAQIVEATSRSSSSAGSRISATSRSPARPGGTSPISATDQNARAMPGAPMRRLRAGWVGAAVAFPAAPPRSTPVAGATFARPVSGSGVRGCRRPEELCLFDGFIEVEVEAAPANAFRPRLSPSADRDNQRRGPVAPACVERLRRSFRAMPMSSRRSRAKPIERRAEVASPSTHGENRSWLSLRSEASATVVGVIVHARMRHFAPRRRVLPLSLDSAGSRGPSSPQASMAGE